MLKMIFSSKTLSKSPNSSRNLSKYKFGLSTNNIKKFKRINSASNHKFIQINKRLVREMEEKKKRGEHHRTIKSPLQKKAKKSSFCKKFKSNPLKFYSEVPIIQAFSYELQVTKDNEIIRNLAKEKKKAFTRHANSNNTVNLTSFMKESFRKELSIISDRSNETSLERKKSKDKYNKRPITPNKNI